jgi:class 3 adenylate cyclase
VEERPDDEELQRLGLYDPTQPDAADQLRLLADAFALGASVEEVIRAAGVRYNYESLMLDLAMRPAGETRDLADFAASGTDPDLVRRLWSAFGLPDAPAPVIRVTPDAAAALKLMTDLAAVFGADVTLGVARVMGSTMARLAETVSGTFRVADEVPRRTAGLSRAEVAESYTDVVRELLPTFLDAVLAVFRRHLVNVSYQTWSTDSERAAVTLERTVCFVDLVGSTELLRVVSIREMATLLRRFEEQVWELVGSGGGRVVKLIGDEAMIVFEDPADACRVGLDLIALSEHPVRIGLAHGTVVSLLGDYYGETVNLAARLVTLADPSTLLASESVRRHAGPGVEFDALEPLALKGFAEPVAVFRAGQPGQGPAG